MSENVKKALGLLADLRFALRDVETENDHLRASYNSLRDGRSEESRERVRKLESELWELQVQLSDLRKVLSACWVRLGGSPYADHSVVESCIEREIARVVEAADKRRGPFG